MKQLHFCYTISIIITFLCILIGTIFFTLMERTHLISGGEETVYPSLTFDLLNVRNSNSGNIFELGTLQIGLPRPSQFDINHENAPYNIGEASGVSSIKEFIIEKPCRYSDKKFIRSCICQMCKEHFNHVFNCFQYL